VLLVFRFLVLAVEGLAVLLLLVVFLLVLLHGGLSDELLEDEIVTLLFRRSLSLDDVSVIRKNRT
jgi:hypothetical protein